jgi:thioesterase domain-containing protein/acyl carrier protein
MQQQPGLAAQDILLSVTTLSFDIAALELFLPLMVGARLVIVSREAAGDGTQLLQRLTSSSATVMQATPTTWQLLLEAGWRGSPYLKILCGGEALPRDLARQLLERSASLWNLYGPTETTIWSTVYKVGPGERSVPIGRPIANTQVYLLDSYLQPVPIGVPGELYIGGVGLARGYLHRPELTAEKFILDPFSNEPGTRLYKTGDLARSLPDGNIEFLGRIDYQVKIRGFRIELGEIETVLSQHPAVRETVVLAYESRPGEKRLVAYVVSHQEQISTSSELRSFLKEKLPDYLVPSTFVTLDALPLTPNGKVDRRALPAPDMARPTMEEGFILPRDRLELQLAKIWEQILGLKSIGVKDNFFDLGGYSLLAVRLFLQIEKVFGEKLPLTTLFQAPTIEQLADVLRGSQAGWSAAWSSLVAIQPGGSNQPFFCVPGNLGNVFVDLGELAKYLGPDQPFYGLQDGIQNPSQIEALATHFVNEIRSVQPEGPYLLGGVCSGGVVAFEMAQQLQAKGQKVALLALIEPSRPPVPGLQTYFNLTASVLRRVVQRFGHHSRNLAQYNSAERGPYAHLKAKLFANMWAVVRYAPKIYPGRITLFLAHESLAKSPHDPRLGWREWTTKEVELQVVPGSHNTITRTHNAVPEETQIRVLAERLRASIDDAVRDVAGK